MILIIMMVLTLFSRATTFHISRQTSSLLPKTNYVTKLGAPLVYPTTQYPRSIPSAIRSSTISMTKDEKPKVVFILGGPGAGKGTQCEKLTAQFDMIHLSAGELLRAERLTGSENGKLIDTYLEEGKIVPVEISLGLLRQAMESSSCNRFLIDGFPRNMDNLKGWERLMSDVCDVNYVIFIECNEEELERRVLLRGATSGRTDDNAESIRKRFRTFREETMPVVELFAQHAATGTTPELVRVDGNQDVEIVYDVIKTALEPMNLPKELNASTASA